MAAAPELSATSEAIADEFLAIGDYALIGNCRTAALVSRDGAVEWLCLPTFSSPSLFAAMLDRRAGHFTVQARSPSFAQRGKLGWALTHCPFGAIVLSDVQLEADP